MTNKIIITVIVVHLFGCLEATSFTDTGKKLVIDQDGGADDAFAITMSLLYEKYFNGPKVVALTTTHGNVNLTQAIINSDRVLTLCNRKDIPIYAGASQGLITNLPSDHFFGYDGLGDDGYSLSRPIKVQKTSAACALLELSRKYEGKLIVVAIGPLTNIALAIRMDPNFIHRLAHLYIGAGHIYSELFPKPEFNVLMDPEAYRIMAGTATINKVTCVPLSQVEITSNISLYWRKTVFGKIPTKIVQALNSFERLSFPKTPSWTILDPVVMYIALSNGVGADKFKNTYTDVILEGTRRGITTNDFSSKNPNAIILYALNMRIYKSWLLKVYSAELPYYNIANKRN